MQKDELWFAQRRRSKTREIWTSILQTLKKRAENPRDKLVKVLNKLSQNKDLDIAEELFGSPTLCFG